MIVVRRGWGCRLGIVIVVGACWGGAPAAARPQEPDLELGPAVDDEELGFTIRIPKHLIAGTPNASWLKRSWEHLSAPNTREVVAIGMFGPTAEVVTVVEGLKQDWGRGGFHLVSERRESDAAFGDRAYVVMERPANADICHLRFFNLRGWVYVLGTQYPTAMAARWQPWVDEIGKSFRITGEPIRTNVIPVPGVTRVHREDLGLAITMPDRAEPKSGGGDSRWIRAVWICPNGDLTATEVSLGFSEAGEPVEAFTKFVRGELERQGLQFERDVPAAARPKGVATAWVLRDPGVQAGWRVYLLPRDTWTLAVLFRAGVNIYERERDWAYRKFIEGLTFTGTPTVLAPRAPKLSLAVGELQRDHTVGVEYRIPTAARPVAVRDPRVKLVFQVVHTDQSTGAIRISEATEGEPLSGLTSAMERILREETADAAGKRLAAPPELGATAYLRLDAVQSGVVHHCYFFAQAERVFCVSFTYKAEWEELWRDLAPPVLLAFRVTKVPDLWVEPPPAAKFDEGDGFRLGSAAVGLAPRVREQAQKDVAAGLAAMRRLLDGPAPSAPLTLHLFADERPLQRVWGASGALPPAFYFAPARLILARGDKDGRTDEAAAERRVAAAQAWRDDRFGTPHALPPWLRVGLDEAARTAQVSANGEVDVSLRRSPLVKWIRANKRKAGWPDVDVAVRKGAPLDGEGEAGRAYALGLVLAVLQAGDEPLAGVLKRYAATLRDTRRPADALKAALEGVDLSAWDMAALAILGKA